MRHLLLLLACCCLAPNVQAQDVLSRLTPQEIDLLKEAGVYETLLGSPYTESGLTAVKVFHRPGKKLTINFECAQVATDSKLLVSGWNLPNTQINISLRKIGLLKGFLIRNSVLNLLSIEGCTITSDLYSHSILNSTIRSTSIAHCRFEGTLGILQLKGESLNLRADTTEGLRIADCDLSRSGSVSHCQIGGKSTTISLKKGAYVQYRLSRNNFFSEKTQFRGNEIHTYPFTPYFTDNRFGEKVEFIAERPYHPGDTTYNFRNLDFGGTVRFKGTLPAKLGLHEIGLKEVLDFTWVDHDSYCRIDLWGVDVDKVDLNYRNFRITRLNLIDGENRAYYENEQNLKSEIGRVELVFNRLLNKYQKADYNDNYRLIDLDYRRYRYNNMYRSTFWDGAYYHIARLWWNFGYEKYRVFFWTLLFFMLFFGINYWKIDTLLRDVIEFPRLSLAGHHSKRRRKLTASFHLTMMIFFGLKLDYNNLNYNSVGWTLYIYLEYIVGLICVAFMFNLIISI